MEPGLAELIEELALLEWLERLEAELEPEVIYQEIGEYDERN